MAKSGVIDEITAHRALEGLPDAWAELAYGRIDKQEARERARLLEPEELVERTARMLTPPTAAETRARLEALLGGLGSDRREKARSRRWIPGGIAALVAAAAVLVLVMPREPQERPFDGGYGMELSQWVAVERGPAERDPVERDPAERAADSDDVWTYRMDRPIEIRLQPGSQIVDKLGVRGFAQRGDDAPIVLPIEPVMVGRGVMDIFGLPRAWGLAPGRWRLTLVIGPPDGLPGALSEVRMDEAAPYDVQSTWLEITEPAPDIP